MPKGHTEGAKQYFKINDNLEFSSQIWIQGTRQEFVDVPFFDETNNPAGTNVADNCVATNFSTGKKGNISLYITQPFVGESIIPPTKLVDLYATKERGVYGASAMAAVYISGKVTVNQGCEIPAGYSVEIPFGEYNARDFKDKKGVKPDGAREVEKTLTFSCTNISDGIKISLRITGTPSPDDASAIKMGNDDIGAVIADSNGKVLHPNTDDRAELTVGSLKDGIHRDATLQLRAWPISTTGKLPKSGDFDGVATINIDVE